MALPESQFRKMPSNIESLKSVGAARRAARVMRDSGIAWIGQVPREWKVLNILYALRSPISDGPHETPTLIDDGIPFVSIDSLNDSERVDFSVVKKFISEEEFARFSLRTKLEQGDVLFSKAATIGKTAIVGVERYMVWSPLAILKPDHSKLITKYLYYVVNCDGLVFEARMSGSQNTQVNVGMRELEKVKMPLPPLPEQRAIAAYLDRECGRIDGLRAKIECQIEKLGEYKKSLITEAVTGKRKVEKKSKGQGEDEGRDAGRGERGEKVKRRGEGEQWKVGSYSEMRDSGVAWIGQVPKGWKICRVKNIGSARNGLTYSPSDICEPEDGVLVLRSSNVQQGKLCFEDNVYVSTEVPEEIMMQVGDILICSRNGSRELIGKNAIVEDDLKATYGAFMMVFRANQIIRPKYSYWLFNSEMFSFYLSTFSTATINQLTRNDFGEMKVPLPPLHEQKAIAEFLDEKCGAIDAMVGKCREELERLAEYKKSLIFECVTGKRAGSAVEPLRRGKEVA